MPTARSTPNIALIKYWGNRSNALRLPANDSLAMVLDTPSVDVTVEDGERFGVRSFLADGSEKVLNEESVNRFKKTIALSRNYLEHLGAPEALPEEIDITIASHIPPSIGLASSAAVFSGLAKALSEHVKPTIELTDEQVSILARLGSGSANRGIHSGYTATRAGEGEGIDSSTGVQIAPPDYWLLYDVILVPSMQEKKVGSTAGHAMAHTSPHFRERTEMIQKQRQHECISAIQDRDFEKLQRVAEEDCMDMHKVMQTQNPPLHYLSDETYRIIDEVKRLRDDEHLEVLYTMDAGPTVHLFCTEDSKGRVIAYAESQKDCKVFVTKVGEGAHLI